MSKKATGPPPMEPVVGDVWKDAAPLTFTTVGGVNLDGGSTEVTMRSVYADDAVYFLIQWKAATLSARLEPWQKQV